MGLLELYLFTVVATAGILRVCVSVSYSFSAALVGWDLWLYPVSLLVALPLPWLVARLEKSAPNRIYLVSCAIRFGLFFMMGVYGLSKVLGQQFTLSNSDLDQRIGQASGACKAWAFFGHSGFYEAFLGWGEVVGALLLLFHQTVLPGAALLAAMLLNIVIANFTHDIGVRANSSLYLAQSLLLLWPDRGRILRFLQGRAVCERQNPEARSRHRTLLGLGRLATFLSCAAYLAFNQWMISKYRPQPHPLVGIWRCEAPSPIMRLRFDNDRNGSLEAVGAERIKFDYEFNSARSILEYSDSASRKVFQIRLLGPNEIGLTDEAGQFFRYQRLDAL